MYCNWIFKDNKFNKIRRLSIYYRIKTKEKDELRVLLVSDSFGNKNYSVIIKGVMQDFRFELNDFKKKIQVADVITLCSNELNSEEFKVNDCKGPDNDDCQNMCNFIPKLYGIIKLNYCLFQCIKSFHNWVFQVKKIK